MRLVLTNWRELVESQGVGTPLLLTQHSLKVILKLVLGWDVLLQTSQDFSCNDTQESSRFKRFLDYSLLVVTVSETLAFELCKLLLSLPLVAETG